MSGRLLLIITLTLFTTFSSIAAEKQADTAAKKERGAIILCYHIVESPRDSRLRISREEFIRQLDYLETTGFNVIPLAHLLEYVEGKRESIPENAVVITIDDGWRCTYTEMYPELKKRNFPFTVFLYPKFINGGGSYALTWDQVREMAADGVDIQSHTFSHVFLTRQKQARGKYQEWLAHELEQSKKAIEKEVGREVTTLAYPYGDYNELVAAATSKAGYAAGLTCDYGPVVQGSNPYKMRRVSIFDTTSFETFRRDLGVGALQVAEVTPKRGAEWNPRQPIVSARIATPEKLDPDTVGMALLSVGPAPFSYDPRNGKISMVVREKLDRNYQQVVIWGNDRKTGKRVETVWGFYLEAPKPVKPADPPAATVSSPQKPAAPAATISDRRPVTANREQSKSRAR